MFRKLSKIVICGSIAIFCTLFANPNATQTINTQNASSIIQLDNLRTQNISDSILSIQELSATNVLINTVVSSLKSFGDVVSNGFCMTAYAQGTFSQYWQQNPTTGNWQITNGSGQIITSAWVCDNLMNYNYNTDTGWYLLDEFGNMREGVVLDTNTGNYFLLNPLHDGRYGEMITASAGFNYNNVHFTFEQSHNGGYGRILNSVQEIQASGLPITQVSIPSQNYYTANFGNSGSSGNSGNSGSSGSSGSGYGAGNSLGGNSGALSGSSGAGSSGSVQSSGGTQQLDSEGFVTNIGLDDELMNGTPCGISSEDMSWMIEMASKTTFS